MCVELLHMNVSMILTLSTNLLVQEMKLAHQTTKFQLEMKLKELELKFLTEQNQRLTAETQLQRTFLIKSHRYFCTNTIPRLGVKREMEDRDTKISHYANTVAKLQRELREERTKSALASKQNAEYSKRCVLPST